MSDAERLEQFRSVFLTAMSLFREIRKETTILQVRVLALENALAELGEENWRTHLSKHQQAAEKMIAAQKSPALLDIDQRVDKVIGLLSLDDKEKAN